jgi:hypothetical protein
VDDMSARRNRGRVESGSLPEPPLRCVECGALSDGDADGWRAYRVYVEEDGEPPELAIYCRPCARLEFGE